MNESQKKVQQRSRVSLVILLLIFLLPVIFAYVIHKNPQWRPGATKNNGILYGQAVVLQDWMLQTHEGKEITLEELRGKWSLIYIGKSECGQLCQQTLLKANNGRIAQGKEASRINLYYLLDADSLADEQAMLKTYPKLVLLKGNSQQRTAAISQFSIDKQHKPGSDDRLYLVDPGGVLLMHYPAGFKDVGLMDDLKHLLKWSQIG